MKAWLKKLLAGAVAAALALASVPQIAEAAATAQTTHAYMCAPLNPAQAPGPKRVVNPATGGGTYLLNASGCAVMAAADLGYFASQGFYQGQGVFTLQQTAITATTTSSTSTITLPAYAFIIGIVLSETAGNAITGGVDIGDSGSATRFASAVTLGANASVSVADSALTRIYAPSGVPAADQVLVACHTACNSGSINITIFYGYW